MLKCVDCDYTNLVFNAEVDGIEQGVFRYVAVCPRCGSRKVTFLPGFTADDLRIGLSPQRRKTAANAARRKGLSRYLMKVFGPQPN